MAANLLNYLRTKYVAPVAPLNYLIIRDLNSRTGDYTARFLAMLTDAGGPPN